MKKQPIFNKKWCLMETIGEGNTSKVYRVKNIYTNEVAALKILKKEHLNKPNAKVDFQ